MRLPWNKSKEVQLDLLDAEPGPIAPHQPVEPAPRAVVPSPDSEAISSASAKLGGHDGRPMLVAVSMLYEDAHNPRTEFPEESLAELAEDIQQRGVLQPLVVHPAGDDGRYQVHFGAKRLRAAIRAGLHEVPVVVRDLPADRDCVRYMHRAGGLGSVAQIAKDLGAHADARRLARAAAHYEGAAVRRLGYLLELAAHQAGASVARVR
jgi:hypothetical protein